MRIYKLTPLGQKLARSVSNPHTPAWRVVHFLDRQGHSTNDQVAEFCGLGPGEAAAILGVLRRKRVVEEVSGTDI